MKENVPRFQDFKIYSLHSLHTICNIRSNKIQFNEAIKFINFSLHVLNKIQRNELLSLETQKILFILMNNRNSYQMVINFFQCEYKNIISIKELSVRNHPSY